MTPKKEKDDEREVLERSLGEIDSVATRERGGGRKERQRRGEGAEILILCIAHPSHVSADGSTTARARRERRRKRRRRRR